MSDGQAQSPRLAAWLLASLLPPTPAGRSVLGDLLEEYQRRPAGLRRRLWFWWTALDVGLRHLPDRLPGRRPASKAAGRSGTGLRSFLVELGADASHAGRLARRYRALASAAVFNLAVAMAVAIAGFAVMNGVWLRTYLAADPANVNAWRRHDRGASSSWPVEELLEVRRRATLVKLEGSVADTPRVSASAREPGEPVNVEFVTGTYLELLGAEPALGRLISADDDRPGSAPVIVLHHLLWRRQFGGDGSIVGRTIWVAGHPVMVVGVAGRDFVDLKGHPYRAWLPLSVHRALQSRHAEGEPVLLRVAGRIARGATMPAAQRELTSLLTGLGTVTPGVKPATGVELQPSAATRELATTRQVVFGMLAVIALVVGLASANVSNLLLAGAEARRHELAVRLSLGASGSRIRRQLATECLLLCLVSAAAGFVLAGWLAPALATFMGMEQADIDPDARVVIFTLMATMMSAVAGGMAPARQIRRHDAVAALKGGDESTSARRRTGRTRSVLLGIQAAVSIVLVVVAALLVRALVHLAWLDPGVDIDRLITVSGNVAGRNRDAVSREYWESATDRVRGIPGVEGVALATFPPFATSVGDPADVFVNVTDADYFAVTGLRLNRGRSYTAAEVAASAPVAVISEQVAARYWRDADPVGASLDRLAGSYASFRGRTVIGIVADAQTVRLHDDPTPFVYLPMTSALGARLVIRLRDPQASAAVIADALKTTSPAVEPTLMILSDRYAREFARPRRLAALGGVVAGLALALAGVGLAGATAFSIRRRTREIAIRLALGASRGRVMREFVRDGMRPVLIGLAAGLVGALLMGRVVAGLLHGVSARDPLALGGAVGVLVVAAVAAILVPLRRTARLDPATVLRDS